MTAPLPALERERRMALIAEARDGRYRTIDGWISVANRLADALSAIQESWITETPPVVVPEGLENAANVRAYLDEAESEWRAARDDSGYTRASMWAMTHGRKLIEGWRRAAQDLASPPPPAAGLPTREALTALITEALWSPASGPVAWTDEKIARAKEQAGALADAILALIGKGG